MRINDNNKKILKEIAENLNFCDIIIMSIFKKYTCKVYRMGFKDAFYYENKKIGKN